MEGKIYVARPARQLVVPANRTLLTFLTDVRWLGLFPVSTLLIALLAGVSFIVAYRTYGRWLGHKIFRLAAARVCPSAEFQDDKDFVPTDKGVVFGHHFTSIAGTGPIVGPAIAVVWGWAPALLWVLLGSIFIGAVHDFGSLVVSLRNRGETVGEIAGRLINRRARLLFLCILVLALTVVLAIFGLVIASVFRQFPAAIFPCLVQIPIAVVIGAWLHRRGTSLLVPSLIALTLMYVTVFYGNEGVLGAFNAALAGWSNFTWVALLLIYSYIASVLPVWILLQPRDFINSLQLISVLGLLFIGLVVAAVVGGVEVNGTRPALEMAAPAFNLNPTGAPAIFPFLFITVACGAISGFHCLVSSGTSSKQLRTEPEARFVGYGSMLTEGFLAVMVILICCAGIGLGIAGAGGAVLTGEAAWQARYGQWSAGLGPVVGTFVDGSANLLKVLGIPAGAAVALMGVFVASFAATTLDTACRLQRYVIQELAGALDTGRPAVSRALSVFRSKHGATLLAIGVATLLAAVPQTGQSWSLANAGTGGLLLWPLFGATNQLLGGLAFLVILFYLWRRGVTVWFLALPLVFMLVMPMWAMLSQAFVGSGSTRSWLAEGKHLLVGIAVATCLLEVWMIAEAVRLFPKVRGKLEEQAPADCPIAARSSVTP